MVQIDGDRIEVPGNDAIQSRRRPDMPRCGAWLGVELAAEDFPRQPCGQGLELFVEAGMAFRAGVHDAGVCPQDFTARKYGGEGVR